MQNDRKTVEDRPYLFADSKADGLAFAGGDEGTEFGVIIEADHAFRIHCAPIDARDFSLQAVIGTASGEDGSALQHDPGRLNLGGDQLSQAQAQPVQAFAGDDRGHLVAAEIDQGDPGLDVAPLDGDDLAEKGVAGACLAR